MIARFQNKKRLKEVISLLHIYFTAIENACSWQKPLTKSDMQDFFTNYAIARSLQNLYLES